MAEENDQPVTEKSIKKYYNVAAFVIALGGLYWGLKMDNQALRDDIKLMISDYKSADKVHDVMISGCQEKNNEQDKSINWLTDKMTGVLPEEHTYENRKRNR